MPSYESGISIVVPTDGREALIGSLLRSIAIATEALYDAVEVIVVDSSAGAAAVSIEAACAAFGATYVRGPESVRKKRNLGARCARHAILLFVDSDCVVHGQLVAEHLRLYREEADSNLGGVLGVTEFSGESNWVWRLIEKTPFVDAFSFAKRMPNAAWCTCSNVSFKKEVFDALGGFDESFPFKLGGDDLDFSWRVTQAGYLLKCNARAVVFHTKETWQRVPAICERLFRWGRMSFHVMRKHPGQLQYRLPGLLLVGLVAAAAGGVAFLSSSDRGLLFSLSFCGYLALAGAVLFLLERRCRPGDLIQHVGAQALTFVYQLGAAIEFIRHGKPAYFVKAIYFDDWHQRAEYQRQMSRVWAVVGALALTSLTVK